MRWVLHHGAMKPSSSSVLQINSVLLTNRSNRSCSNPELESPTTYICKVFSFIIRFNLFLIVSIWALPVCCQFC